MRELLNKFLIWLKKLLAVAVLGSVITVGAFQVSKPRNHKWADWTGFGSGTTKEVTREKNDKAGPFTETITYQSEKTLWDWLELTGTLAVPILIFIFGLWFEQRENERADKQAEVEGKIAKDNLAEEAIQAYLDRMSDLLLNKEHNKKLFSVSNDKFDILNKDNAVRDVARTQTITILRRLKGDKARQARIIDFLRDAELYQFIFQNANLSKIDLSEAHLRRANLQEAHLRRANLQDANLTGANLQAVYLRKANLQDANLGDANLQQADLGDANLQQADLTRANLQDAKLWGANLLAVYLGDANLQQANLLDFGQKNKKFANDFRELSPKR